MMYDETNEEDGATDEAIADFTMFHDTYLVARVAGHEAYLTYQGRPVIFIFPKGGIPIGAKVRTVVSKWDPPPLLIDENLPGHGCCAFDGFYAWINTWPERWARTEATGVRSISAISIKPCCRSILTRLSSAAHGQISTTARRHGA